VILNIGYIGMNNIDENDKDEIRKTGV